MNSVDKKPNLERLTITTEPSLIENVKQHRLELVRRTGLRVSTSAAVSALIQAGLEAQRTAPN